MKAEFLPNGSPDCPLIRLYDFDVEQAEHLRRLALALAEGAVVEVLLQEASWITAVSQSSLTLQVSKEDQGVKQGKGADVFFCRLSRSSWLTVADLISPFCKNSRAGTYQWLDETGPISLLLSPDGRW